MVFSSGLKTAVIENIFPILKKRLFNAIGLRRRHRVSRIPRTNPYSYSKFRSFCSSVLYPDLQQKKHSPVLEYFDIFNTRPEGITFHSRIDDIKIYDKKIENSFIYTSKSDSKFPFVINTRADHIFSGRPPARLNHWPKFSELTPSQKGFYVRWLSEGKPQVEDPGYLYLYLYGLEYRTLVENKSHREILFELVKLADAHPGLCYIYNFIIFLILKLKKFSEDESILLVEFFQYNEEYFKDISAYYSILRTLNRGNKTKIKFTDSQLSENNSEIKLKTRKKELLHYYITEYINGHDPEELYDLSASKYLYHMAMKISCESRNVVQFNELVPSEALKQHYREAEKIISEIPEPITNFLNNDAPLSENECHAYLPASLLKNIPESDIKARFALCGFTTVGNILNMLGITGISKLDYHQSRILARILKANRLRIEPDAILEKITYTVSQPVCVYEKNKDSNTRADYFNAAAIFMDLGILLSFFSRSLPQKKLEYINSILKESFLLNDSESQRLCIRSEVTNKANKVNAVKQIRQFMHDADSSIKVEVIYFALSVAASEGQINTSKIRTIKHRIKSLGCTDQEFSQALHKMFDEDTCEKIQNKSIDSDFNEIELEIPVRDELLSKLQLNNDALRIAVKKSFQNQQTDDDPKVAADADPESSTEHMLCSEPEFLELFRMIQKRKVWSKNELLNIIQDPGNLYPNLICNLNGFVQKQYGTTLLEEAETDLCTVHEIGNLEIIN